MSVHSLAMSGIGDLMMLTTSKELYDSNCMINVLDVNCICRMATLLLWLRTVGKRKFCFAHPIPITLFF